MFVQLIAPRQRKLMLSVLLFAAGTGFWANHEAGLHLPAIAIAASTECTDTTDVLAALERSRNGVSLTCNSETLLNGEVR